MDRVPGAGAHPVLGRLLHREEHVGSGVCGDGALGKVGPQIPAELSEGLKEYP
jgi:hypothetical protein